MCWILLRGYVREGRGGVIGFGNMKIVGNYEKSSFSRVINLRLRLEMVGELLVGKRGRLRIDNYFKKFCYKGNKEIK